MQSILLFISFMALLVQSAPVLEHEQSASVPEYEQSSIRKSTLIRRDRKKGFGKAYRS
jgi:hypothetical protein